MNKLLLIFHHSPYSNLITQEGIELLLLASSYSLDISVLFMGNAVLGLVKRQHPNKILRKNISKMLKALPLYEIKNIYAEQQALEQYQLTQADFVIECQSLDSMQIKEILHNHQGIINC